MSAWRATTLDHLVRLQRGHDLPSSTRRNGSVPVVGAAGPSGFHDTALVRAPGVVVGRAGASMGKATYCEVDFWPLNTALYVTDFLGNDPRFVYYLLGQIDFSGYNSGAAQPMLNRNYIKNIPIKLPERQEQESISALLGSLDDKIAVNNRIVAKLQELGDAFYGQAVSGIAPGEESFASTANVFGGGTPRTSEPMYWDGDIMWTTPSDVTALQAPYLFDTKRKITSAGLESCASRLYPAGSIFMTSRATIGSFAVPQRPAAVNQGFIVVIPQNPALCWWLFHEMRSRVDEMLSLANGSTFLELSRKTFKAMSVRLASPEVVAEFDAKARALHRRAAHSAQETQTLTELRDALLPKLLSGEVKVRQAEKVVEAAI
ncbi:restriction endonuclease subunit S [Nonomuraea jiangxiensis]|uniref:Type I restriction enzyme, S subunit n=1 Tax=Nonomuraea jiangxiensis TaxID=633440 RepID=A0A1G9RSU9_9ACTN|nr:restriction endonuclease subunit S [Nonomuraea jiangxiensis]SDM26291.1 type I restriction enzyme, S subunit [Nonomuraea jiangxiensis]